MKDIKKGICLLVVIVFIFSCIIGCGAKDTKEIRIGIIQNAATDEMQSIIQGFEDVMAESGLEYEIEIQNASGDTNLANSIAQKMVDKKVDLIFSMGTLITQGTVSAVNNSIPIVAAPLSDFVAAGVFVDKDNSSNENITGVTDVEDLDGIINFIGKVSPGAKRIGMVYSSKEANAVYIYDELFKNKLVAQGYEPVITVISDSNEIPMALDRVIPNCDVFVSFFTPTVSPANDLIVSKAAEYNRIVIGSTKESVEQGFFGAITLSYYDVGRTSAEKAIAILNGTRACDIPVENAVGSGMIINKSTADSLGIDLSQFDDASIIE